MNMLDLWARTVTERTAIEEFLDFLQVEGHQPPRFHSGKEAALDKFFGIDRRAREASC